MPRSPGFNQSLRHQSSDQWVKTRSCLILVLSNYYFESLREPDYFPARITVVLVWSDMCLECALGVSVSVLSVIRRKMCQHIWVLQLTLLCPLIIYCIWWTTPNARQSKTETRLKVGSKELNWCNVCSLYPFFCLLCWITSVSKPSGQHSRCLDLKMIHWRSVQTYITFSKQTLANKTGILDSCVYTCHFDYVDYVVIWIIC